MLHRRNFCKAVAAAPVALASPMLMRSSFADEVSSIVIVSQHGLPYLPLMVMDSLQLVQKHAARLGIASLKPEFKSLGGTQSLIDALLSRQMDFGVTGVPSLCTLWDKTAGTPNEVRALSAVQSMPFMLVTNKPEIKTIKDFTSADKIAVPAIKVSSQAICLQMAAAKEWGDDQYARLDAFTITRSHPDAAVSLIAKTAEIDTHYSVAPYYYYELATSGVHNVLKSYDTLGGPGTNGVMLMSRRFHDANPKVTQAVHAALTEAEEFINKNPGDAAEIYIKTTNEKRSNQEEMTKFISDPDNIWTTTPQQTMTFAGFMHKVGTMKREPVSWKDLYMPECHELAGS
ncbi:ABC transporter substrate-binding protein [Bradyrhizobium erythrophlei]|uniref:NitT/TauT family transport system substrate-binding protein n=1 Tax=Bradyrhizobium erythrophlei TaxID=1437360 RepID=A0A1M7TYE9_9BRAD|nr:ABC transporter substrate-binding protein [Bradyrhizobium erythrophlei]SHN75728.1 NitT/TauT family transport system substrate-binding protein [Bradyrhizobium erythrophlei]